MKSGLPIDTQILWLAAELVEHGGHCKKVFRYGDAFCALGAIGEATRRLGESIEQRDQALWRLRRKIGSSIVYIWNDHPSRTAEEVALALRTA